MANEVTIRTRVLPGKRIELYVPQFNEGDIVDVVVTVVESATESAEPKMSMLEFIESLPPSRKTPEEWEQFEKDFQAERDSWDR